MDIPRGQKKCPAADGAAGFPTSASNFAWRSPKSNDETAVANRDQHHRHRSEAKQAFAHLGAGGGVDDETLTVTEGMTVRAGDEGVGVARRMRLGVGDVGCNQCVNGRSAVNRERAA